MPFSAGKIVRTGGRKKNRYGISLPDLPPFLQKFVLENNQIKDFEDDQHLSILFKMREREFRKIHKEKIYICPFTGEPATTDEIAENAEKVKFKCFHSGVEIISKYNDFSYENLTHPDARTKQYNHKEFLEYTEEFRKFVSEELTEERKLLVKYIKNNSKY